MRVLMHWPSCHSIRLGRSNPFTSSNTWIKNGGPRFILLGVLDHVEHGIEVVAAVVDVDQVFRDVN